MRHGLAVSLIGLTLIALASTAPSFGWLCVWSGCAWLAVGLSYTRMGPRIFGKGTDGRLSPIRSLLLLPYLLPTWALWHLQRITSREHVSDQIVDGVWLGRRCSSRRLPPNVDIIVDMTCEFQERAEVTAGRHYVCVPTADGSAPAVEHLAHAVEIVVRRGSPVYVHCAVGHGRSAMFVAALMVRRGLASTALEAETMIRAKRPLVSLNAVQRRRVDEYIRMIPPT